MPAPTPAPNVAPDAPESKSIFTRRTTAGLALVLLPIVAKHFGYTLDDRLTQDTVEFVFAMIGGAGVIIGRMKAAGPAHLLPPAKQEAPEAWRGDSARITPAGLAASLLISFLIGAAVLWLSGCAADTRRGRVTNAVLVSSARLAGRVLVASVARLASDRAKGLQLDCGHAAAAGLWANAENIITAADVERVVRAWAGPAPVPFAAALAARFESAAPDTAEGRAALVRALAEGISKAALAGDFKTDMHVRFDLPLSVEGGLAK